MGDKDNDRFAPFVSVDAGDRLTLRRPTRASALVLRGLLHVLVFLPLLLLGLIGLALATRPLTVAGVIFTVVAIPVLWMTTRLMPATLAHDGVTALVISPAGLQLSGALGFGRRRTLTLPAGSIEALVGAVRSAKPRVELPTSWWLALSAWAGGEVHDLGWLAMRDGDDGSAMAAAQVLADRLGVPLERVGLREIGEVGEVR